jgi:hypothetical protein
MKELLVSEYSPEEFTLRPFFDIAILTKGTLSQDKMCLKLAWLIMSRGNVRSWTLKILKLSFYSLIGLKLLSNPF